MLLSNYSKLFEDNKKTNFMKKYLVNLFWFLRLHEITRYIFQRNKTTIIYYHDIEPKLFNEHLKYLKKKYSIISLEDYVFNRVSDKKKYRLIITFDDGHISNFNLLEVIKKHKINCTIFLVSNLINSRKHFWFKWNLIDSSEKAKLKKLKNSDREKLLFTNYKFDKEKEQNIAQALNLEQIYQMKEFVSFQSHTHTHPCLNKCDNVESNYEIQHSKLTIEFLLKNKVFALAFPNGDFEQKDCDNAKLNKYSCVLTSKAYYNSYYFKNFELNRLSVNDFSSIKELALRSSGFYFFIKKIINHVHI